MIKKGSIVEILKLNPEDIGFKKLYPDSMSEYVGTHATVLNRKNSNGYVEVLTNDEQRRSFFRKDVKVIK